MRGNHGQLSRTLRAGLNSAPKPRHYSFKIVKELEAATQPPPRVIFSGIQPTGIPHLGNYLGALSNWVLLQNTAHPTTRVIYSLVGYHAITLPQDSTKLRNERYDLLASLLAIGIDPKRSILYCQDEVPEHTELAWILGCLTPMGKLQRMTTWKSKLAVSRNTKNEAQVDESHLNLGLFAYPVLQAADILLYKATDVPVGEDQTQHLELSRDLAALFNKSVGAPVFPIPKPIINPAKRILSLKDPTQKMSKSAPNPSSRILLTDSFNQIKAKLKTALTDSERSVSFDPVNRPGVSNLLTIYASCHGDGVSRPEDIAVTLQGKSYSEIKNIVASVVDHRLRPIRQEYERIRMDEGYLRSVAEKGTMQATEIAARTMEEVKSRMGLGTLRDRLLLRGKSD